MRLDVTCVCGSTEAESIAHLDATEVSVSDSVDMAQGRGLLVGRPVPEVRIRIIDHEVQIPGGHMNTGYLDTAEDADNKVAFGFSAGLSARSTYLPARSFLLRSRSQRDTGEGSGRAH